MKNRKKDMADTKVENPPDVVQVAPSNESGDENAPGSSTASPASSPTEGKSDNYFSRKFGSVLNRSLRKFKKGGSQEKNDAEKQNGHENGEQSPTSKSAPKSPRSPGTPKTPDGSRQSKFQRIFRSSKRSKSADYVETEAASTSNILDGEKGPAKEKHTPLTKYGEQKQIVVDGKAMKEIEVKGEKQQEILPETRRHRRISKSRRKAEFEGDELKVQCRDLNPADYEGWLYKKSGGTTLSPVVWKQCWVVLKHGILYLYKTSFDIAAQHAYSVRNFSIAPVEEKKKFTFKLAPKNVPPEALQDAKGVVFSCESNEDVERWCEVLNKAALGFIIQPSPRPEKEEPIRRRCQSSAVRRDKPKTNGVTGHRVRSTTFTGETTGLPSTFIRSGSQSRSRKVSGSGTSSVLAVGSMFLAIDEPNKRKSNTDLSSIVYKEQLIGGDDSTLGTKQPTTATAMEDEVRMEVKKEVERINKHSKPAKPIEGKGQTVASTKKADKIREEIMNLKEIESQRANNRENTDHNLDHEVEASEEKEATSDPVVSVTVELAKDDSISNETNAPEKLDEETEVEESDRVEEGGISYDESNRDEQKAISKSSEDSATVERNMPILNKVENGTVESEDGDDDDSGISVEDYLRLLETEKNDVTIEQYLAQVEEQEKVFEERSLSQTPAEKTIKNDKAITVSEVEERVDQDNSGTEESSDSDEEVEEQVDSPKGMIPAKQQRMLIDAVLSLDYPSESESEGEEEDEEICHYAKIERPSTQGDSNSDDDVTQDEQHLNIIISAPTEFGDQDTAHQTNAKIRDHILQYGATTEGKSVAHHTFIVVGGDNDNKNDNNDSETDDLKLGKEAAKSEAEIDDLKYENQVDVRDLSERKARNLSDEDSTTEVEQQTAMIRQDGTFDDESCQKSQDNRSDNQDSAVVAASLDPEPTAENEKETKKTQQLFLQPVERQQTEQKIEVSAIPTLQFDSESIVNEPVYTENRSGSDGSYLNGEGSVLINMISSSRTSNASEDETFEREKDLREIADDEERKRDSDKESSELIDESSSDHANEDKPEQTDAAVTKDDGDMKCGSAEEDLCVKPKATVKIVKVSVVQRKMELDNQEEPKHCEKTESSV